MKPIDLSKYKRKGGYNGWLYLDTNMKPNGQGFNRFQNLKGGWCECFDINIEPFRKEKGVLDGEN